jgi:hypothetical protein
MRLIGVTTHCHRHLRWPRHRSFINADGSYFAPAYNASAFLTWHLSCSPPNSSFQRILAV